MDPNNLPKLAQHSNNNWNYNNNKKHMVITKQLPGWKKNFKENTPASAIYSMSQNAVLTPKWFPKVSLSSNLLSRMMSWKNSLATIFDNAMLIDYLVKTITIYAHYSGTIYFNDVFDVEICFHKLVYSLNRNNSSITML